MKIQLDIIRGLLRRMLGFESFAASFITAVREDPSVPTACINPNGLVRYNPDFVQTHVRTEADLFCLVFHELLHPAFGHFIHGDDPLANIACDAIINSVITHLFAKASDDGCLFARFYPERGLSALLRRGSKLESSRYARLYEYLYPQCGQYKSRISAGEVIQTLKALSPPNAQLIVLLGSHPLGPRTSAQGDQPWPEKQAGSLARAVLGAIQNGPHAGYCANLVHLIVEVLQTKATLREDLLRGYTTRQRLDAFFETTRKTRRTTSPVPINPSRRDLVLLSVGIWPGLFHYYQVEFARKERGIAVFLDVSGSVDADLPEIIGILSAYRNRITSLFLFSNKVVEVPFEQVVRGQLSTTYGTDFDCVAETVLEKEYEKALVVTDGCASLKPENAERLQTSGAQLLTVLFGGGDACDPLKPFGEVIPLEKLMVSQG